MTDDAREVREAFNDAQWHLEQARQSMSRFIASRGKPLPEPNEEDWEWLADTAQSMLAKVGGHPDNLSRIVAICAHALVDRLNRRTRQEAEAAAEAPDG